MPKFSKVKMKKGQSTGPSPGGSPKFKSSSGGKGINFKVSTPSYKKVRKLKASYSGRSNKGR